MHNFRLLLTAALQAAHIVPVDNDGPDIAANGIPLRADLHLLFDAKLISISEVSWKVDLEEEARSCYGKFHNMSLKKHFSGLPELKEVTDFFKTRKRVY